MSMHALYILHEHNVIILLLLPVCTKYTCTECHNCKWVNYLMNTANIIANKQSIIVLKGNDCTITTMQPSIIIESAAAGD